MKAVVVLCLALLGATLARAETPEATASFGASDAAQHLLVRGTTDIAPFAGVLDLFVETRPDLRITYEQWSSNDLYARAAQACALGETPADLLISSSVDQMVKLVNDGCARPHRSAATAALPASLNWRDEIFGITREPAVIVYNRRLVPAEQAPQTRFDLIDLLRPSSSPFAGRVATYDIESSGLGYLFAFMDSQQATTFGSLIEAFGRSGAVATCCSSEIIDGVASGRFAIAYNVLGSYALARARANSDLVVLAPRDYTLILSRAAMIPAQASQPRAAADLLDFLLSVPGRAALGAAALIVAEDPEAGDVAQRQIPLSPVLLVGLDREKRAHFLAIWRGAFRQP